MTKLKMFATQYVQANPEYILQDQETVREGVPPWYNGNTRDGLPKNAPINILIGGRMYQYPRREFMTTEEVAAKLGYTNIKAFKNRIVRETRHEYGVFGTKEVPCVLTRDGGNKRWLFLKPAVEAMAKDPQAGTNKRNAKRPESREWLVSRLAKAK